MDIKTLLEIVNCFDIVGTPERIEPLGNGLINDTFRVKTSGDAPDYVLQRINHNIFKDVDLLQNNIVSVTNHIRRKLLANGTEDIERKVLRFVPLKGQAQTWILKDGNYWRVSVLIPDSYTHTEVTPESSFDTGRSFGHFEEMLSDIPDRLGETIPDFHNMELRSRQLADAVRADAAGRVSDAEVKQILQFFSDYDDEMTKAERLYREGLLPKRICHCDPKVNNILFDADGKVLCVIDLDTVMPSFVFSDFGDFLRTAANTLQEDDPDFRAVEFKMDIFRAFSEGYLEATEPFLTPMERENLPYGTLLFPYMQAVRFFTDYLNGDKYYRIQYPEHNLVRTRNQIALFKSAIGYRSEMDKIVGK